jgi:hypothetical protein
MSYMDLIPGDYSNAPTDADRAAALLASEPRYHRGLDTPMRREASRTIKFTWDVGEGDLWKNQNTLAESERVPFFAVLTVTHNKKDRSAANYSASLWQHHGAGASMCVFDGRNGLRVLTDTNGAGRYNANKLEAFAHYALAQLRERANDPAVLVYFKPERV